MPGAATYPSEAFGIAMQRVMGRHLANFILILLPVLFFGFVQGVRYGFGQKDYGFLTVGSFVSIVLAMGYGIVAICEAYGTPRRLWMYLAVWGGMLPYLFVVYLTFYWGVWGFIQSLLTISAWGMLSGVLFAALGLFAISFLKLITNCSGHISMLIKSEQDAQHS